MALLGREPQLQVVAGYLAEASDGHGRMVFVAGEAGIGKSTFVGQVLADAVGVARVASGTCDGAATPAPLGPLLEMLPQLPADVWPSGATRQEMFARLVGILREPRQREPYLLVIEDAHWADEATLDLIRHLSRRIHSSGALVLVTYRPETRLPDIGCASCSATPLPLREPVDSTCHRCHGPRSRAGRAACSVASG